jgi:hypothetical protein
VTAAEVLVGYFSRQAAMYASGVGLGASKGKEIGKYSEGYSGYVDKVKDVVSGRWGMLRRSTLTMLLDGRRGNGSASE